jgi:predicted metal-binding membrane protein
LVFINSHMSDQTVTEQLLRRERAIVLVGLALIIALAWCWVLAGAGTGMSTTAMTTWQFPPPTGPAMHMDWGAGYAVIMFFMWWIMMIAMMTPSATPMILLYARVYRHGQARKGDETSIASTFSFAMGYLTAWAFFSLIAVLLQWGLERLGVLHAMMMWSVSPVFSGSLLIIAGVYQLTPLKNVCLEHCRSPVDFLSRNFRPGPRGAFGLGWHHGLYCLGCCWFLMGLLFAGGIMNLVWIAGLAILVLIEKVAPGGHWVAKISGVAMILAGAWVLWAFGGATVT